jgi:hypothetical protein
MNAVSADSLSQKKTPWHLWVVGVVALLWNASGAYTIMMAQAGRLPNLTEEEAAYYAAQPLWFVIVTDIALISAMAAAAALLLRHRSAVVLFAVSLAAIFLTDAYDLVSGTAQMLTSGGALIVTVFIFVIAVLELVYANTMKGRGVLQ